MLLVTARWVKFVNDTFARLLSNKDHYYFSSMFEPSQTDTFAADLLSFANQVNIDMHQYRHDSPSHTVQPTIAFGNFEPLTKPKSPTCPEIAASKNRPNQSKSTSLPVYQTVISSSCYPDQHICQTIASNEGKGNNSEKVNARTEGHRAVGTNPKAGNLGQHRRTLIEVGNSYLSLSSEECSTGALGMPNSL